MKKRFLLLGLALAVCLTGCGKSGNVGNRNDTTNAVDKALNEQMEKEDKETEETTAATTEAATDAASSEEATDNAAPPADVTPPTEAKKPGKPSGGIDIDLTEMGADMVYATVSQMMTDPEAYIGQKVKMGGKYYSTFYEPTQQYYFYVLISDAMACCQNGLEFVWGDGSHVYPDEYPPEETEVTVTGIFETYKDNPDDPYSFCRLKDAELEIVN